ncbi:hypothetical protein [Pseudochryseolinea flava]|uniref:Lipoprotein n=1 Tax=Pseudochryseolinea flava TaxID=2059302 RepID=A0A364XV11_9BACT|nr:hypothetical protein [Pseudochryseolinea flava]RAV97972.1 hypothetical protein DQQ10_26235 [Pseudochryseolinea flava]
MPRYIFLLLCTSILISCRTNTQEERQGIPTQIWGVVDIQLNGKSLAIQRVDVANRDTAIAMIFSTATGTIHFPGIGLLHAPVSCLWQIDRDELVITLDSGMLDLFNSASKPKSAMDSAVMREGRLLAAEHDKVIKSSPFADAVRLYCRRYKYYISDTTFQLVSDSVRIEARTMNLPPRY